MQSLGDISEDADDNFNDNFFLSLRRKKGLRFQLNGLLVDDPNEMPSLIWFLCANHDCSRRQILQF